MADIDVDVYPVGLCHDLRMLHLGPRMRRPRWWYRQALRRLVESLGSGRRSYLNGYLAEPRERMGVTWTRCGHGWTRARALRDLEQHMAEVAP